MVGSENLETPAYATQEEGYDGMRRLLSLMASGGTELNGRRRTNVHATELLVRRSTGPPPGPASPSTAQDNAPLSRGSDSNEEGES